MLGALGALRAGAVLVPLNTRFKGDEAAYILRDAGATVLLTVRGFLGVDYPALLTGEDVGACGGWCCCATRAMGAGRGAAAGVALTARIPRRRATASTRRRPRPGRRPCTRRRLRPHLHLGHHRLPQGGGDHSRPVASTFGTWASIVGLGPGDRYLVVNPFFHTFGYKAGILACLMAGATVVPEPVFDAAG